VFQGFAETFLFLLQHLLDAGCGIGQFRIGIAHHIHQILDQLVEERLGLAQLVAVAQCAAHDAAQHIAAPFAAGDDAVDHQERTGADMVGDDFERIVGQVHATGFTRSRNNQ